MHRRKYVWLPILGSLLIFLIISSCACPLSGDGVSHSNRLKYLTTRRQAIIDFVSALQMDDGLFVNRLDTYYSVRDLMTSSYAIVLLSWIDGLSAITLDGLIEYCISCQRPDGGFGLDPYAQLSLLTPTLAAIRLLYASNHINDIRKTDAINWIYSLQCDDGGFTNAPPAGAESAFLWDTAGALEAMKKLGVASFLNHSNIMNNVLNHQNADGGFSLSPNEESSNIGTFFAIKALLILNELHKINVENVTDYVKTSYDSDLELFAPQKLSGIYNAYLSLVYLDNLESINVDKAADFVLSLQSHLHGAFVSSPTEIEDRRKENIRPSHDLVEVLIQLGEGERLGEDFEVQEAPVWNEPTTPSPPPIPLSPEVIFVFILIIGSGVAFVLGYLFYVKKPKQKKKIKRSISRDH